MNQQQFTVNECLDIQFVFRSIMFLRFIVDCTKLCRKMCVMHNLPRKGKKFMIPRLIKISLRIEDGTRSIVVIIALFHKHIPNYKYRTTSQMHCCHGHCTFLLLFLFTEKVNVLERIWRKSEIGSNDVFNSKLFRCLRSHFTKNIHLNGSLMCISRLMKIRVNKIIYSSFWIETIRIFCEYLISSFHIQSKNYTKNELRKTKFPSKGDAYIYLILCEILRNNLKILFLSKFCRTEEINISLSFFVVLTIMSITA